MLLKPLNLGPKGFGAITHLGNRQKEISCLGWGFPFVSCFVVSLEGKDQGFLSCLKPVVRVLFFCGLLKDIEWWLWPRLGLSTWRFALECKEVEWLMFTTSAWKYIASRYNSTCFTSSGRCTILGVRSRFLYVLHIKSFFFFF